MPEAQANPSPQPNDDRGVRSLKQRALTGSMFTMGSYVISQVLRFGSNLILTRILFPEAFGLMTLVQTFLIGLEMFSDVGIRPSIIQNKRGNDPTFLNTAWTIQVFRGTALWLCACLIAYPVAQFYQEPMLAQLLPVVGLTSLISGLNSTKLATANRQLSLGRLTLIELGNQIFSIVVMVVFAWWLRSVWALVIGGLASSILGLILSHLALPGEPNRLHWDKTAFKELHRFGRWVFLSTLLTFVAGQGDRLVLAHLLDVRFLGVYTLAVSLSRVVSEAVSVLGDRVLFPSYSELVRDRPERLYPVLRKVRLILISVSWSASLFFILFGQRLIELLYDNRYADAGWILRIMPIGALLGILGHTYGNILLAKGKTATISGLLVIQIVIQFSAMFLGATWGGPHGVVMGLAATGWIMYPVRAVCYAKLSLWQPEIDLPLIAIATGIAGFILFR